VAGGGHERSVSGGGDQQRFGSARVVWRSLVKSRRIRAYPRDPREKLETRVCQ